LVVTGQPEYGPRGVVKAGATDPDRPTIWPLPLRGLNRRRAMSRKPVIRKGRHGLRQ